MSGAQEHFKRIKPLTNFERRIVRNAIRRPGSLPREGELLLRYATNLARLGRVRTPGNYDIDMSDPVDDFRGWFLERVAPHAVRGEVDSAALLHILPEVRKRLTRARNRLVQHYAGRISADVLEREIGEKALVIVLGGGGGAGFAHMGAFSLLHDIGWTPNLIVGASMGSLMGLFRAIHKDWDPIATLLALPRRFDRNQIFQPFAGQLKYGFPGAFFLRLNQMSRLTLDMLIGRPQIRFEELEIPLEVLVTGVRLGMKSALRDLPAAPGRLERITGFNLRKRVRGIIQVLRTLVANPRFLRELVFGRDTASKPATVMDAVGFSCAVPGLFCYDLPPDVDRTTHELVHETVAQQGLWGLADGGVTNNVPSRVAFESVWEGTVGTRNAFIYALDPFAPQVNSNVMFMPVQQIAALSAGGNQPYSDLYRAYQSPPSPLELVLSWNRARTIISASQTDLERDRAFLERIREPLPRFDELAA